MNWQYIDTAPMDGTPVMLWNREWIDEDFNPTGAVEGFYSVDGWMVAVWNNCTDTWMTIPNANPTMWAEKTAPSLIQLMTRRPR